MTENITLPEQTKSLILDSNNRVELEKNQLAKLVTVALEMNGIKLEDVTGYVVNQDGSISVTLKDAEQVKDAE